MSGNPNISIIFVINSKEWPVSVNPNSPIKSGVVRALTDAGLAGDTKGWEARTEDGTKLDLEKKFSEEGITSTTKIFLSKGAGRGGAVFRY